MAVDIRKRLPDVSGMYAPFVWIPTQVMLDMPSGDNYGAERTRATHGEYGPVAGIARQKASDEGFGNLCESLADGWLDPVCMNVHSGSYRPNSVGPDDGGDTRVVNNGNHRIVAAAKLGFTHVPVTYDQDYRWLHSSDVSCSW
jgi:hypothetical protein